MLRGFFALACLTPGFNTIAQRLNERLRSVGKKNQLPPGARVLARPHADERFVTCLASSRGAIHTELFDGGRWIELPMTTDSLVILPGRCLAKRFGIRPTVHRVLHLAQDDHPQQPQSGITLLLGAAPIRPAARATNWTNKVVHNPRRNGGPES